MTESIRPVTRAAMISLIISLLSVASSWAQDNSLSDTLAVDVSCDAQPNLTGNWILNVKASDDMAAVIREAMGGGQNMGGDRKGGDRKGGGRGGGRGGGMGNTSEDPARQVKAQQRLARIQEEYSRMEIFHDGIELNVTNGLDISRLLFTDNRRMNIWTQQGEATATAHWQDRTLVVEWKTSQDTMSRIRYYTLSETGYQLVMTESRRLPGQDKTVKIRMVYDLGK